MRLIDADALAKEAGKLWAEMPDGVELSKELMKSINHAPTVDAVPVVHGYWDDSFDGITPYCSVCHMSQRTMNRTPNYCPNCGAKMDGEANDHG